MVVHLAYTETIQFRLLVEPQFDYVWCPLLVGTDGGHRSSKVEHFSSKEKTLDRYQPVPQTGSVVQ